jgi:hypothetical protein
MLQIFIRPHTIDLGPRIQHGPLTAPEPNNVFTGEIEINGAHFAEAESGLVTKGRRPHRPCHPAVAARGLLDQPRRGGDAPGYDRQVAGSKKSPMFVSKSVKQFTGTALTVRYMG